MKPRVAMSAGALVLSLLVLFAPASAQPPGRRGPALPAGVKVERNIPYVENGHANQVLDLYLPESRSDQPLPLVIWIHGGAWLGGSHANPSALFLLNEGFAVASIEYRFSGHAQWPAQGHDCKAAIRWLRAHAEEHGLDPDHFGVGGESAGGHLAAFVGTSGNASAAEGELGVTGVSSAVQAVVDEFGPTDLVVMADQANANSTLDHDAPSSPESRLLGGPPKTKAALAATANPITYVDHDDPPFLILHGSADPLVPPPQSAILAKALIDAGVEVTMRTIDGAGHGGPQFTSPESRQQILDFFNRHLKQRATEPPALRP